jgi:hypothetical protein
MSVSTQYKLNPIPLILMQFKLNLGLHTRLKYINKYKHTRLFGYGVLTVYFKQSFCAYS